MSAETTSKNIYPFTRSTHIDASHESKIQQIVTETENAKQVVEEVKPETPLPQPFLDSFMQYSHFNKESKLVDEEEVRDVESSKIEIRKADSVIEKIVEVPLEKLVSQKL